MQGSKSKKKKSLNISSHHFFLTARCRPCVRVFHVSSWTRKGEKSYCVPRNYTGKYHANESFFLGPSTLMCTNWLALTFNIRSPLYYIFYNFVITSAVFFLSWDYIRAWDSQNACNAYGVYVSVRPSLLCRHIRFARP